MKKYLVVLILALVTCSCIGFVAAISKEKGRTEDVKIEESEKQETVKKDAYNPEYAWIYSGNNVHKNAEQQAVFDAHTNGCDVEARAILEQLGLIEKKSYTSQELMDVLKDLDKHAMDGEIVRTLDKVAGVCDKYGGSGMDYYFYETIDGVSFKVQNATVNRVIKSGEEYTNDCIYSNLLGFNADGWTKEELFEPIGFYDVIE